MKKEIIVGAVTNARDKLDNPKFFINRDDLRFCGTAGEGKDEAGLRQAHRVQCSQDLAARDLPEYY